MLPKLFKFSAAVGSIAALSRTSEAKCWIYRDDIGAF